MTYDLDEFLKLSAVLNYQLVAKRINWNSIMSVLLGKNSLPDSDKKLLLQAFEYLNESYGERKRRLGPLAVLHPFRVSAILSRTSENPSLVEYLTALFHDIFEDIRPEQLDAIEPLGTEQSFQSFFNKMQQTDRWFLIERLKWLTKRKNENYYNYVGRLLDQASGTPEVVRAKLADRLDNTLDMRIDLDDPLHSVDFFEIIFQVLYNHSFAGFHPYVPHAPVSALNGAERLYQLFKNVVLMSLVRQKNSLGDDKIANLIFENLARASMQESQRIALHIFGYHLKDVTKLRDLLPMRD